MRTSKTAILLIDGELEQDDTAQHHFNPTTVDLQQRNQ